MSCVQHQFFEVQRGVAMRDDINCDVGHPADVFCICCQIDYVLTMCALCGERRNLYANGKIEIIQSESDNIKTPNPQQVREDAKNVDLTNYIRKPASKEDLKKFGD